MEVEMARKWIQKAIKHPGAFRAKAKRARMSTIKYARKVLANPKRYDTQTVRQAHLALTLLKIARRRKK
jgi:hypothetical protein